MDKTTRVGDAVESIPDGAVLMIGGFMAVGTPRRLIDELVRQGKKGLTVIANDTARPGVGIGQANLGPVGAPRRHQPHRHQP
jgi:acetate CoA/acetoacetate CoA-transferase alpha subunit